MGNSDRLIDIVEDHEGIRQFLNAVCFAIESGTDMPNFVPVLNDTLVTDQLGMISHTITELRKKLL